MVLDGSLNLSQITFFPDSAEIHGITFVRGKATGIDSANQVFRNCPVVKPCPTSDLVWRPASISSRLTFSISARFPTLGGLAPQTTPAQAAPNCNWWLGRSRVISRYHRPALTLPLPIGPYRRACLVANFQAQW
ncbi:MAG: hypothetical protein IPL59_14305 [Candidatus Competibacteraceae bacterium]|nr:hypothetical protein [Candidatus Competibacteraceae bacterium]